MANRGRVFVPILILACTQDPILPVVAESTDLPTDDRPSLVLVTLDTTRADRIGAYGHELARTPALDRFATEGVRFDRAYATVPLTIPSHASMMSGLYPSRHGIHNNGDAILPESVTTLAEILRSNGYRTAASVSAFVTTRAWNFDQGFDSYFDELGAPDLGQSRWASERSADAVVDDLVAWLDTADPGQPAFIWAHFYDPHHPYVPHESVREEFGARVYDAEIAFMDTQIARLRDHVHAHFGDDVAWILVADHGEALGGEHDEQTHGLFLFEPTMRIPFIIRPPHALEQPVVVSDLAVSNVDVMPTGLGMLGLHVPEGLDGIDLGPLANGVELSRDPVFLESENVTQRFGFAPEIAIVESNWKLMDTPSPLLFDLETDPDELANIIDEQPERVERLRLFGEGVRSATPIEATQAVATELMDELMALGYVSHDAQSRSAMSGIDAKDHSHIIRELERALALLQEQNDPVSAEEIYRRILEEYDSLGEARLNLARSLTLQDRLTDAEAVLRDAIELQPQSTVLRSSLANNLASQDRHEEGLELIRSVLVQVPEDQIARLTMLKMLTDLNRFDEVIDQSMEWLEVDPENHGLRAHLGVALCISGNMLDGIPHLEASLVDDVPRQLVHRLLAENAVRTQQPELAIHHLERENRFFPGSADAHRELGALYLMTNQLSEARSELLLAEESGSDHPRLWLQLAQRYFNEPDFVTSRAILDPVLDRNPENPHILLLHANLLNEEGQEEEARAVFATANELLGALVRERTGTENAPLTDE